MDRMNMEEDTLISDEGPIVHVRVVSSDRERPSVSRSEILTPYVVELIAETLRRTRPGAWIEVTVPPLADTDDIAPLRRQLSRLGKLGTEVIVRSAPLAQRRVA